MAPHRRDTHYMTGTMNLALAVLWVARNESDGRELWDWD